MKLLLPAGFFVRYPTEGPEVLVLVTEEVQVLVEEGLLPPHTDVVSLGLQVIRLSQHQVAAHHRTHYTRKDRFKFYLCLSLSVCLSISLSLSLSISLYLSLSLSLSLYLSISLSHAHRN